MDLFLLVWPPIAYRSCTFLSLDSLTSVCRGLLWLFRFLPCSRDCFLFRHLAAHPSLLLFILPSELLGIDFPTILLSPCELVGHPDLSCGLLLCEWFILFAFCCHFLLLFPLGKLTLYRPVSDVRVLFPLPLFFPAPL